VVDSAEEEQIEALKSLWEKYGSSLLTGAAVALFSVAGYQMYTGSVQEKGEAASAAYEQVIEAQRKVYGENADEEAHTNLMSLASAVMDQHSGTTYAHLAAFVVAKSYVEKGEYDAAAVQLKSIIDDAPSKGFEQTAKLRLARVYLAQEKYDDALALLATSTEAFKASFEETKGDIYRAQGEVEKAREAYQAAASVAETTNPLLQIKLDDVAG